MFRRKWIAVPCPVFGALLTIACGSQIGVFSLF